MKPNIRVLAGAALSCAVLAAACQAAEPSSSASAVPSAIQTAAFSLPEQEGWSCSYGSVSSVEGSSVLVSEEDGDTLYHLSEDSLILSFSGEVLTLDQLQPGDGVYVYGPPMVMLSLPAQAGAALIVAQIPADAAAPAAERVTAVDREPDALTVYTERMTYHVSSSTELLGRRTLEQLQPGDYVAAWYPASTKSIPAQAAPEKLAILPGGDRGWIAADTGSVLVDGTALELTPQSLPQIRDGALMLPLRPVLEAMGDQVFWHPDRPGEVTVVLEGDMAFRIPLGEEEWGAYASDGVTFLPLDRILSLTGTYFSHHT